MFVQLPLGWRKLKEHRLVNHAQLRSARTVSDVKANGALCTQTKSTEPSKRSEKYKLAI